MERVTHRQPGELRPGRLYAGGYEPVTNNRPSDPAGLTTSHFWGSAGHLVEYSEIKPEELA